VMPKKLLGYDNPSLEDLPDDFMLDILSRLLVKSMAYSKYFPRILAIRSGLDQWLICMWEVGDDGDEDGSGMAVSEDLVTLLARDEASGVDIWDSLENLTQSEISENMSDCSGLRKVKEKNGERCFCSEC
ncbi:hypothetical protein Tco_0397826, partial [Tanacetum coccineum]